MPLILAPSFNDTADGVARIILQVEMKKQEASYEYLTEGLNLLGAKENVRNVRNKIARGTFSAGFFFMCMIALGLDTVKIELNKKKLEELGIK